MNRRATTLRREAFTLVEMMVVVAAMRLLPAFSAVRGQAKIAQANAQFKALDTGINAFRAEAALWSIRTMWRDWKDRPLQPVAAAGFPHFSRPARHIVPNDT